MLHAAQDSYLLLMAIKNVLWENAIILPVIKNKTSGVYSKSFQFPLVTTK